MAEEPPAPEAVTTPPPVPRANLSTVLRNSHFRKLWLSQLFSMVAGNMLNFALVIKIYQLTGSNVLVSILVALVSIPPVLFSSLAGIYADNFNRKYILLLSNVARAVIVVGLIYLGHAPLVLLLIAFFVSTISQFFGPAESSSIPVLVKREEYFSANSLFVFTMYATFLVGFSLAGPALAWLGELRTFTLLVVFFVVAAINNITLPSLRDSLSVRSGRSYFERAFGKLRHDFREGMHMIQGNRLLLVLLFQVSVVFGFERAVIALIPDLAETVFRYSLEEISYFLIAPAGLGAFVGALMANVLKTRLRKTTIIFTGLLVDGLIMVVLPLYAAVNGLADGRIDLIIFTGLIAFLSGLADVFIIVAAQTIIHEQTPSHARGRVFGSLITLMNLIGLPLILGVGLLTDTFPIVHIVFGMGLIVFCMVLGHVFISRRRLRLA